MSTCVVWLSKLCLESISPCNSLHPETFSVVGYFLLLVTFNIFFFGFVIEVLCSKMKLPETVVIGSIRIFRQKVDLYFWRELCCKRSNTIVLSSYRKKRRLKSPCTIFNPQVLFFLTLIRNLQSKRNFEASVGAVY